jgi:hypothetical protein
MLWYRRLARTRPLAAVALLFGGAAAISAAALVTLGPRGSLVPELLYLAGGAALVWFLGLRFTRAAFAWHQWTKGGWAVLALGLVLDAFALFVSVQAALVALDLALPFEEVDASVVSWQYHFAGRGPGSLHVITADGADRAMPAFDLYAGPRSPGRYRLEITRFEGLVLDAVPLP